jgi:hypothetical protein
MTVAERRVPGRAGAATGGPAQRHPALLAAQRWPGRSRPPESRTHPRLAEHPRKEELKCIDYRVPPELAHLLVRFDGSILVDRTWGEEAARCDSAAANVLGLNMVHEFVTVNAAWTRRGTSEPNTVAYHLGLRRAVCRAAAVRGSRRAAPKTSMRASPLERCYSRWRAGSRTRSPAARKRPIVAPGLTHGVHVGVATSPRDSDAPAWLRVPRSAARLGVM